MKRYSWGRYFETWRAFLGESPSDYNWSGYIYSCSLLPEVFKGPCSNTEQNQSRILAGYFESQLYMIIVPSLYLELVKFRWSETWHDLILSEVPWHQRSNHLNQQCQVIPKQFHCRIINNAYIRGVGYFEVKRVDISLMIETTWGWPRAGRVESADYCYYFYASSSYSQKD